MCNQECTQCDALSQTNVPADVAMVCGGWRQITHVHYLEPRNHSSTSSAHSTTRHSFAQRAPAAHAACINHTIHAGTPSHPFRASTLPLPSQTPPSPFPSSPWYACQPRYTPMQPTRAPRPSGCSPLQDASQTNPCAWTPPTHPQPLTPSLRRPRRLVSTPLHSSACGSTWSREQGPVPQPC